MEQESLQMLRCIHFTGVLRSFYKTYNFPQYTRYDCSRSNIVKDKADKITGTVIKSEFAAGHRYGKAHQKHTVKTEKKLLSIITDTRKVVE